MLSAMRAHILHKKLSNFGTWASENETFIAATVCFNGRFMFQYSKFLKIVLGIYLNHCFTMKVVITNPTFIYICFIRMQEITMI